MRTDLEYARHLLESEVAMVMGAIDLVASRAAWRVTLAGLHFAEQVAGQYAGEARGRGVRLEPLYWPDDTGCDLLVRLEDDA